LLKNPFNLISISKGVKYPKEECGVSTFDVTIFYSPYNIYILDYGKKT